MSTVGVVIGTYGDAKWVAKAKGAIVSVQAQTCAPDDWIQIHGATLADARNKGAKILGTDYLIFLDADDELDSRYVEEMRNAMVFSSIADTIYRPITQGIHEDGTIEEPRMIPRTDLKRQNCIVIGAMCPSHAFFEVGGFDEWPIMEDWSLWRKLVAKGCDVKDVEHAIYKIHVLPHSRNSNKTDRETYHAIIKANPL